MAEDKKEGPTANDVKKFLSTPEPISMQEFKEFWDSLSDEEKQEMKAGLPKPE